MLPRPAALARAQPLAQRRSGHHADRDRLAVAQREPRDQLQRMSERVPQVEPRPVAHLVRIALDHERALTRTAAAIMSVSVVGPSPISCANSTGSPMIPAFTTSASPERNSAPGRVAQHVGVDQDQLRLLERAHQVLALRQVHRHLASHARIDHREQGGRDLHEGHAPQPCRRHEPRHVTDHSAAQRDDRLVARQLRLGQTVVQVGHGCQRLVGFAVEQQSARPARIPAWSERGEQAREVMLRRRSDW